jgi:YbbR domain-containing protein
MAYHPFRHLGLKFLSVAVAFGLWFVVAGERTVERSLRVPLEIENPPARLELLDNPPPTVEVRVRGASGLLSNLGPGDLVAIVDLSSARPGRRFFRLTSGQVRAPFGVEVLQVTPTTVALRFEPSAARRVPVSPVVEGEPAPGYVTGTVAVTPSTVEVSGPETALRALTDTTTEPVSVAGVRTTVTETVTLSVPDPSLRIKPPGTAVVSVEIRPSPVDRVVAQVPVRIRNLGRGLSAQVVPAVVGVTARGPAEVVDALQSDSISAFVDLAGLGPGRYNLSVRLDARQDVVVVRTEPSTVRVRIK